MNYFSWVVIDYKQRSNFFKPDIFYSLMRFTANLNFFDCISRALSEPKILVPEICLPTGNPVLGITIILHTVFFIQYAFPGKKQCLNLYAGFLLVINQCFRTS